MSGLVAMVFAAQAASASIDGALPETPTTFWTRQYEHAEPGWLEREVLTTAAGSTTTTNAHAAGNVLASVDGAPVDWNAVGEVVTDHRGHDLNREADRAADLVRVLSAEDFPGSGVQVAQDGTIRLR